MFEDLTIVVATYNSQDVIISCLDHLKTYIDDGCAVVVVDNNSSDKTLQIVASNFKGAEIYNTGDNYGFGYSFNKGVDLAKTKYVAVINADIEVNPNTFSQLISALEANERACIAAPVTYDSYNNIEGNIRRFPTLKSQFCETFFGGKIASKLGYSESIYNPQEYKDKHTVEWIKGAIWCVRKEFFEQLNGMRTDFFLYSEETEFCWRCNDDNLDVIIVPESQAIHIGGESDTHPLLFTLLYLNKIYLMKIRNRKLNFQLFRLLLIASCILRLHKSASRYAIISLTKSFVNFEKERRNIIRKLNGAI